LPARYFGCNPGDLPVPGITGQAQVHENGRPAAATFLHWCGIFNFMDELWRKLGGAF
jgi:hypothetical protein